MLVQVTVWFGAFFIYLMTTGPVIQAGDSGELITAAYQLGIPHPPGYPLFVLWEKFWITCLPFGSVAFRATLGTAVAAALAVGAVVSALHQIGRRMGVPRAWLMWSLVSMGWTMAWSRTLWGEAVEAEVYTLHVLMLTAIGWMMTCRPRHVWAVAVLIGCGVAHHHSFLLTLPFLAWALWYQPVQHGGKTGALFLLSVGLGLSVYGVMMMRSLADPLMDWGNPDTFRGVLEHALRKQYGTISRMPRSWDLFVRQLTVVGHMVWAQMTPLGLVLSIAGGAWDLLRQSSDGYGGRGLTRWRGWGWGSVMLWLTWTLGVALLLNFPLTDELMETVEVFFIPAHVLMAVGAMFGLWWWMSGPRWWNRAGAGLVMCLLPIGTWWQNEGLNDRTRNFLAHDYAGNILQSIDEAGQLLTKGDNQMFPLAYAAWVDRLRSDVKIYDDYAYIFTGLYGNDFSELAEVDQSSRREERIRALWRYGERPLCYTAAAAVSLFPEVAGQLQGLVYCLVPSPGLRPPSPSTGEGWGEGGQLWRRYVQRGVDDPRIHKTYLTSNIAAQYHYFLGKYWLSQKALNPAKREFARATQTGYAMESMYNNVAVEYFDLQEYDEALRTLELARSMNPLKAEISWNIGTVQLVIGRYEEAIASYREAIRLKSNYVDAHLKLGEAYFGLGQKAKAIQATQEALRLNPNHAQALANLQRIKFAPSPHPSPIEGEGGRRLGEGGKP